MEKKINERKSLLREAEKVAPKEDESMNDEKYQPQGDDNNQYEKGYEEGYEEGYSKGRSVGQ